MTYSEKYRGIKMGESRKVTGICKICGGKGCLTANGKWVHTQFPMDTPFKLRGGNHKFVPVSGEQKPE